MRLNTSTIIAAQTLTLQSITDRSKRLSTKCRSGNQPKTEFYIMSITVPIFENHSSKKALFHKKCFSFPEVVSYCNLNRNHRQQLCPETGYTLLEALIVTLLVTLTITMAVPSFKLIKNRHIIKQAAFQLQNQFTMIKSYATTHHKTVIICGSKDKTNCQKDWSKGYMSFEDKNNNRKRDAEEKLISFSIPFKHDERFSLLSCSRRYFRTSATGPMASIAGRILIKATTHEKLPSYTLYISRIGRTRLEKNPISKGC